MMEVWCGFQSFHYSWNRASYLSGVVVQDHEEWYQRGGDCGERKKERERECSMYE